MAGKRRPELGNDFGGSGLADNLSMLSAQAKARLGGGGGLIKEPARNRRIEEIKKRMNEAFPSPLGDSTDIDILEEAIDVMDAEGEDSQPFRNRLEEERGPKSQGAEGSGLLHNLKTTGDIARELLGKKKAEKFNQLEGISPDDLEGSYEPQEEPEEPRGLIEDRSGLRLSPEVMQQAGELFKDLDVVHGKDADAVEIIHEKLYELMQESLPPEDAQGMDLYQFRQMLGPQYADPDRGYDSVKTKSPKNEYEKAGWSPEDSKHIPGILKRIRGAEPGEEGPWEDLFELLNDTEDELLQTDMDEKDMDRMHNKLDVLGLAGVESGDMIDAMIGGGRYGEWPSHQGSFYKDIDNTREELLKRNAVPFTYPEDLRPDEDSFDRDIRYRKVLREMLRQRAPGLLKSGK